MRTIIYVIAVVLVAWMLTTFPACASIWPFDWPNKPVVKKVQLAQNTQTQQVQKPPQAASQQAAQTVDTNQTVVIQVQGPVTLVQSSGTNGVVKPIHPRMLPQEQKVEANKEVQGPPPPNKEEQKQQGQQTNQLQNIQQLKPGQEMALRIEGMVVIRQTQNGLQVEFRSLQAQPTQR